jgi:hypothetical protein
LVLTHPDRPQAAEAGPDFKEVYGLAREHLPGMTEVELNRAAVDGLIWALGPRLSLVRAAGSEAASAGSKGASPISQASVHDGGLLYLRVRAVEEPLAAEFKRRFQEISATNRLRGVALDLRYARGEGYAAAAQMADVFQSVERVLLEINGETLKSTAKPDPIRVPVAVLINSETEQASEALAAILRDTGAGLLLGSKTAGRAFLTRDFPLSNGDRLRVATTAVKVGAVSALNEGVLPDIVVDVSAAQEKEWYADAYAVLPRTNEIAAAAGPGGTNLFDRRQRMNEADLVRERRRGALAAEAARAGEVEAPVVRDPTLARALDVLKGLAVVKRNS